MVERIGVGAASLFFMGWNKLPESCERQDEKGEEEGTEDISKLQVVAYK